MTAVAVVLTAFVVAYVCVLLAVAFVCAVMAALVVAYFVARAVVAAWCLVVGRPKPTWTAQDLLADQPVEVRLSPDVVAARIAEIEREESRR